VGARPDYPISRHRAPGFAAVTDLPDSSPSSFFCVTSPGKLVRPAATHEDGSMGGGRLSTVLSLVRDNDCWRVRITWPSGIKKYFGKFDSEQDAAAWIDTHRWLSNDDFDKSEIRRKSGPRVRHEDQPR